MIKVTSFGFLVYHPTLSIGKVYNREKWISHGYTLDDIKQSISSFLSECQETMVDRIWEEPFYESHHTSAALQIISSARHADSKKKREYQKEDFIDEDFIYALGKSQHNECEYCGIQLNWENRSQPNGATIERLDNTKAHIKSNCVLSCYKCNMHTSHT
jgi:hypothetical protein